jgi:ABC-type Na+ efflux pump permease subunit
MRKTLEVAWREFKSTALTKAFILAAVLVPLLMIALGVLGPILFNPKPPPLKGTIAVINADGRLAKAAHIEFAPERIKQRISDNARELQEAPSGLAEAGSMDEQLSGNPRSSSKVTRNFEIALALDDQHSAGELESLKKKVAEGELVAVITTDNPATAPPSSAPVSAPETAPSPAPAASSPTVPPINARLFVPVGMNIKHSGLIEDLLQSATARARIEAAGLDVGTVLDLARAPDPVTVRVSKGGQERTEGTGTKIFKMMVPAAFMMLLWIGAFVSSNYLLTTTIEEKSNKVMEVLLSAVSPMQLMSGKIIGQAAVGIVMVGMYLGMGLVALVAMAAADLIEWQTLVYFALYYVMAYFMIAAIMAAIGSAVNELREAQSLVTPAMLVLTIPLMLWLPISSSPNGMLATVTSFIPPLIPFVMVLRVSGDEPIPMWQVIASIVIGYAAMFIMVWMAARVFRVGVLMYGKPPSLIELFRWLRHPEPLW